MSLLVSLFFSVCEPMESLHFPFCLASEQLERGSTVRFDIVKLSLIAVLNQE
jgi:hypothetical protein